MVSSLVPIDDAKLSHGCRRLQIFSLIMDKSAAFLHKHPHKDRNPHNGFNAPSGEAVGLVGLVRPSGRGHDESRPCLIWEIGADLAGTGASRAKF